MLTFLYYLPFGLLGLALVFQTLLYLTNTKKQNYLGINEYHYRFYYYVIPTVITIIGFYLAANDFKDMYVSWSIYGISILFSTGVEIFIQRLRHKIAMQKISHFTDELKKELIKREKKKMEEKEKEME